MTITETVQAVSRIQTLVSIGDIDPFDPDSAAQIVNEMVACEMVAPEDALELARAVYRFIMR